MRVRVLARLSVLLAVGPAVTQTTGGEARTLRVVSVDDDGRVSERDEPVSFQGAAGHVAWDLRCAAKSIVFGDHTAPELRGRDVQAIRDTFPRRIELFVSQLTPAEVAAAANAMREYAAREREWAADPGCGTEEDVALTLDCARAYGQVAEDLEAAARAAAAAPAPAPTPTPPPAAAPPPEPPVETAPGPTPEEEGARFAADYMEGRDPDDPFGVPGTRPVTLHNPRAPLTTGSETEPVEPPEQLLLDLTPPPKEVPPDPALAAFAQAWATLRQDEQPGPAPPGAAASAPLAPVAPHMYDIYDELRDKLSDLAEEDAEFERWRWRNLYWNPFYWVGRGSAALAEKGCEAIWDAYQSAQVHMRGMLGPLWPYSRDE